MVLRLFSCLWTDHFVDLAVDAQIASVDITVKIVSHQRLIQRGLKDHLLITVRRETHSPKKTEINSFGVDVQSSAKRHARRF